MKKESVKEVFKALWFPIAIVGMLAVLVVVLAISAIFFPPKPEFVANQEGISFEVPVYVRLDSGVSPWLLFSEQGEPYVVFSTKTFTKDTLKGKIEKWGHDSQGIPLFVELATVHATPLFVIDESGEYVILFISPNPPSEQ